MDELFRIVLNNAAWAAGVALVALAGSCFLRRRPALVHTLWLLVLLKLVMPSVLNVAPPWGEVAMKDTAAGAPVIDTAVSAELPPIEVSVPAASSGSRDTEPRTGPRGNPSRLAARPKPWNWLLLIAIGWLAGAVVWWAFVALSIVRFRRLLRLCIAGPEALQDRIAQIAIRIGLGQRRRPLAVIVPARIPPFVWAWPTGRPQLLLPQQLWMRLDESQQDALLAHELAHLKRGDHWVRWLEAVVLGLYWWDPIAWLARWELERTEEESCDAWVLWSQPSEAGSYAEALVATMAFLSGVNRPLPLGASGVGSTFTLKRRLAMLASDSVSPSLARSRPVKSLILAAAFLPLLPVMSAATNPQAAPSVPQEQAQVEKAHSKKESEKPAAPAKKPADGPAEPQAVWINSSITVFRPVVRNLGGQIELEPARLQPASRVNLTAPLGGTLQKVNCKPGQRVKQGDVLFELDARYLELELQKAEAEVKRVQARLAHLKLQVDSPRSQDAERVLPVQADRADATSALLSVTADRDLAKLKLDSTKIQASFDGLVSRILSANASYLQPGEALATVIADKLLSADVFVEEFTARRLEQIQRKDQNSSPATVRVAVRDEEDFPHKATIDFINREVEGTGQVRLRILVPNPDGLLNPGLFARVQVDSGPAHDSLFVPDSIAMANPDGRRFLLVLNAENVVVKRYVQFGERVDDLRVIEQGLKADDWVVEHNGWQLLGSKIRDDLIVRQQRGR